MCGGRGSRLDLAGEKPLVEIGGRPMVDRVADALAASGVDRCYAVTSPQAPRTAAHVTLPRIDAPGEGYVADLRYALDRVDRPVLTVAADLPLLTGDSIDAVCGTFDGDSMTVCVTAETKRRLGVCIETTRTGPDRNLVPTGLNVIADGDRDRPTVVADPRLAVNVNRARDARVAEALIRSGGFP